MNTLLPNTKICAKCKEEKPLSEFCKSSKAKNGVKSYCKVCDGNYNAKRYLEKKDKLKKQVKRWQKKNPEKVKGYIDKFWQTRQTQVLPPENTEKLVQTPPLEQPVNPPN